MPYPVQKYIRTLNQFCVATNAFTPEEVDKIIHEAKVIIEAK